MARSLRFKIVLSLLAGLLVSQIASNAQLKSYNSNIYGTKQYGSNYDPSTLCAAQDNRGIFYFGSANGILEFDGYFWNFIDVKPGLWIRSIAIGPENKIYIGSQNEFGLLMLDSIGRYAYISLSDSIKDNILPFSTVWKIHVVGQKVYFQAEENIFEYNGKNIRVIDPSTTFHTSFVVGNKIYVRQRSIGLMELKEGALQPVKGGDIFKETGIFGMFYLPKSTSKILIFTQESGFWLMDDNGISAYNSVLNSATRTFSKEVFSCQPVSDNELAFSTFKNGVYFTTIEGNVLSQLNQVNGLPDNNINSLTVDLDNNIWLTTNKGITRIDDNSDLSVFTIKDGIESSVYALAEHKGLLYAGLSGKLMVQNKNRKNYYEKPFAAVQGLENQVWALENCEGKLVVGTNDGLYKLENNKVLKISNIDAYCLKYIQSKKMLFSAGSQGLMIYDADNLKFLKGVAPEIDVKGMAVDDSNPDELKVWLGSNYQGVTKIKIKNKFEIELRQYTTEDGLKDGFVIPFKWNNKILFNNNLSILTFISEEENYAVLPDSLKYNENNYRGFFDIFKFPYNKNVYYVAEDEARTWLTTGLETGFILKDDSVKSLLHDTAFKAADLGKINIIYPGIDGNCWIGASEGLIKYEKDNKRQYNKPFYCLLRKVQLANDSIIYHGEMHNPVEQELSHSNNSVNFLYSSTFYNSPDKTMFSYLLEGVMEKWSEWDEDHSASFMNLREGEYTFKVKARNVYGTISEPATYKFIVLPPWYRSWWAYTIYIVAGLFLIWLIVKLNTYRLQEKNKQLERIVEERTREVVMQKEKIELQNVNLEQQNKEITAQKAEITDSIKYAKRIQSATLPNIRVAKKYIDDIFVLYKPRDIVSGDFYWCTEMNNMLIIVAADCTGHGVPGAFMSMLGMSFLNTIIIDKCITDTGIILDQLRNSIIASLHQHDVDTYSKDGMDVCLCAIDKPNGVVYYSGAFNPLLKIREGELVEHEVDRMPVAVSDATRNFVTRKIEIKPGDCLYMFSDGYCDQFGGPRNKKFMKLNFKNKLLDIHTKTMEEQRNDLDETIETHRGNNFQTDDILVIGLKI